MYRKNNMTADEEAIRFKAFVKTVNGIEAKNAGSNKTSYGITMFADWTDLELAQLLRPLSRDDQRVLRGPSQWIHVHWDGSPLPRFFDWRHHDGVTPIKRQQLSCNSCWAHAVTATMESLYKLRFKRTAIISEQEVIDCDYTNNGCISGSTRRATMRGLTHGFVEERLYQRTGWCNHQGTMKLKKLYAIHPDENSIAWFISNFGPVTLNVAVPLWLYKDFRGRGVMRSTVYCESMIPNHAVEAIGFGEEHGTKYWIAKNSWGPEWGDHGYFKIERGVDACHVESFPTSAAF